METQNGLFTRLSAQPVIDKRKNSVVPVVSKSHKGAQSWGLAARREPPRRAGRGAGPRARPLTHRPLAARTHHGGVVLLQGGCPDRPAEEPPVADGVLLPLEALVQQLVVQQEQLVAEGADLI